MNEKWATNTSMMKKLPASQKAHPSDTLHSFCHIQGSGLLLQATWLLSKWYHFCETLGQHLFFEANAVPQAPMPSLMHHLFMMSSHHETQEPVAFHNHVPS
jgi:hypothetical protein